LDETKFGLPPCPYVTIEGHRREDARIFFGRNGEIRELYDWAMQPAERPVLLFYGQSGVGKSWLLGAGLMPRLENLAQVRYLRRGSNLTDDLHQAMGGATEEAAAAWL